MAFGNFDFAEGTDFEKKVIRWLWEKYPDKKKLFCKPDIYDVKDNIMIEAKCTRPYYDKDPAKYFDEANDLGTGLPINQYERYKMMRKHNIRVVFIHKLTEGKFIDKIFVTELTDELEKKVKISDGGQTVYWLYSDLNITKINI